MSSNPTFDELERLIDELDAGERDSTLPTLTQGPAPAGLTKFAEVKPFDVRAWAERKGIKLPEQVGPTTDGG